MTGYGYFYGIVAVITAVWMTLKMAEDEAENSEVYFFGILAGFFWPVVTLTATVWYLCDVAAAIREANNEH